MPILVKPLAELDNPVPSNGLDRRNDGFDPLIPYQMIPLNRTREMVVQTGDFQAGLTLIQPGFTGMSNFRVLRQTTPNTLPMPLPGVEVDRVVLPSRSTFQFTLSGRRVGMANLEGQDRPGNGPPLKPDLSLLISIKSLVIQRVAVCYLFDRINADTGARADFFSILQEANKVFLDQSNTAILNIDGAAVNTSARSITLSGTIGKSFILLDKALIRKITSAIDSQFPTLFRAANIILLQSPVPLRLSKEKKGNAIGVGLRWRRASDRRAFTFVILGPQITPPPAKSGGGPSPARIFQNTVFHEIGHCLGLRHHPSEIKDLPPLLKGKAINPAFFRPNFRNLMFPTTLVVADSLNFAQVEKLHRLEGPIREFEF